ERVPRHPGEGLALPAARDGAADHVGGGDEGPDARDGAEPTGDALGRLLHGALVVARGHVVDAMPAWYIAEAPAPMGVSLRPVIPSSPATSSSAEAPSTSLERS